MDDEGPTTKAGARALRRWSFVLRRVARSSFQKVYEHPACRLFYDRNPYHAAESWQAPSIIAYGKLVLVLFEPSIQSDWVHQQLRPAGGAEVCTRPARVVPASP